MNNKNFITLCVNILLLFVNCIGLLTFHDSNTLLAGGNLAALILNAIVISVVLKDD